MLRTLHTFAVALWFGSVAFFTVAGLLIFQAFRDASATPADERPAWLPLPALYDQPAPKDFPDPLRLEQGSRLAGVAVSRIFPVYYAAQAGCAVVALLTAALLARSNEGGGHRLRVALCALALATVLGGWWLESRVADLRTPRNDLTDRALASPALVSDAVAARADFGRWHGYSLLQNFATLLLTGGLTLLIPAASVAGPRGR